jgi:hypothetical protein
MIDSLITGSKEKQKEEKYINSAASNASDILRDYPDAKKVCKSIKEPFSPRLGESGKYLAEY